MRQFLRLYELIGVAPGPAHPAIRFMATGAMGTDYAEHVATEMAVGEGLVLMVFLRAHRRRWRILGIVKILEVATTRQEERHASLLVNGRPEVWSRRTLRSLSTCSSG